MREPSHILAHTVRPWWCLVSLTATLAVALPLALAAPNALSGALGVATVLVCWLGVMRSTTRGAHICQIIFWTFYGCWLGIAPLYQVSRGLVAWNDSAVLRDTPRVHATQLLVLLAAMAFLAGTLIPWRKKPTLSVDGGRARLRGLTTLSVVGVAMLPLVVIFSGGFGNLFATRDVRGAEQAGRGASVEAGGGPLLGLVSTLPAAVSIVVAYLAVTILVRDERHHAFRDRRIATYALVAIGVLLIILYSNPFANTRFLSAAAGACVLLAYFRPRTGLGGAVVATLAAGLILFAYPFAYALRKNAAISELSFDLSDWAGLDFDGFQQWINAVQYTEEHGFFAGAHIAGAVLYLVPRSIWSGKPEPASITIAENRGLEFTNLSLPFPGELYLDLGILGLIAGMLLVGWAWKVIDLSWVDNDGSLLCLIAPVVAAEQIGFIRGPLGSLAPVFVTITLLALIAARSVQPRSSVSGAVGVRSAATSGPVSAPVRSTVP